MTAVMSREEIQTRRELFAGRTMHENQQTPFQNEQQKAQEEESLLRGQSRKEDGAIELLRATVVQGENIADVNRAIDHNKAQLSLRVRPILEENSCLRAILIFLCVAIIVISVVLICKCC